MFSVLAHLAFVPPRCPALFSEIPMTEGQRTIRNMAFAGWLIPLGSVLLCFTYYLRARLELGYWPTYGKPDPKVLRWYLHHVSIYIGLLLTYPAFIWSGALAVFLFGRSQVRSGTVILIGSGLIFGCMHMISKLSAVDEFFAWFID